jgi:hypothetical protein
VRGADVRRLQRHGHFVHEAVEVEELPPALLVVGVDAGLYKDAALAAVADLFLDKH